MRRSAALFLSVLAFAFCLSAPAWGQPPEMPEKIRQFWDKMAKAKTLAFLVQVWDWEQHKEIAPRPYKRLRQTFEVKIQRPNRMAVLGSPPLVYEIPEEDRTGIEFRTLGSIYPTQISDGRRSLLLDVTDHAYLYAPPLISLEEPVASPKDNTALLLLHNQLRLYALFEKDPMRDFVPLPASHPRTEYGLTYSLSLSDDRRKAEEHYVFDKDTGQLRSWSYWDTTTPGKETEIERMTFRHWDFDPPLPRSTFDTRIPRGYTTMEEKLKELKARRPADK